MKDEGLDEESFGEILSTMLAAGASNDVLGRFALMFRNKGLAQLRPVEMEMGPVLEAFASEVAGKVVKAVTSPSIQGVASDTTAPKRAATAGKKTATGSKIIVLKVNGQRTSVSLNRELYAAAVSTLGGPAIVSEKVVRFACETPPSASRSAYVQAQVRAEVEAARLLTQAAAPSSPMH